MWYEATVRYLKEIEDGKKKRVTEKWLVEANFVHDVEVRISDELAHLEEFEVAAVKETKILTVYSNVDECDKYYLAKLATVEVDEKGREKRIVDAVVINQADFHSAYTTVREAKSQRMADEIVSVSESNIKGCLAYD